MTKLQPPPWSLVYPERLLTIGGRIYSGENLLDVYVAETGQKAVVLLGEYRLLGLSRAHDRKQALYNQEKHFLLRACVNKVLLKTQEIKIRSADDKDEALDPLENYDIEFDSTVSQEQLDKFAPSLKRFLAAGVEDEAPTSAKKRGKPLSTKRRLQGNLLREEPFFDIDIFAKEQFCASVTFDEQRAEEYTVNHAGEVSHALSYQIDDLLESPSKQQPEKASPEEPEEKFIYTLVTCLGGKPLVVQRLEIAAADQRKIHTCDINLNRWQRSDLMYIHAR